MGFGPHNIETVTGELRELLALLDAGDGIRAEPRLMVIREKLQRLITPTREPHKGGKLRVFARELGFDLASCSGLLTDIGIIEKMVRNERVADAADVCRMSLEAWTATEGE